MSREISAPVMSREISAPVMSREISAPVMSREISAPVMSRETILGSIKKALGKPQETVLIPRNYRLETGEQNLVALLEQRILDYRARVQITNDIQKAIQDIIDRLNISKIVVPHDLPETWLPSNLEKIIDHPNLAPRELENAQAVITGSALAIAETGTIVLDHSTHQGRRALTLIPDIHICIVFEKNIVDNLPSAISRLSPSINAGQPLTFISGPSATSDIELNRVEGVHGPRVLEVVVVI
jgi:L-lactate dehydrogenase complex protein LldG